jgi:hypothetical protein
MIWKLDAWMTLIKPFQFVKKQLNKKEKTFQQIYNTWNTWLMFKNNAGLAYAILPNKKNGILKDVDNYW